MSTLLIAEIADGHFSGVNRALITAAKSLGGELHVLVAGIAARTAAEEAAKVPGVAKILLAEGAQFKGQLAEELAPLIVQLAATYSHIIAPASTFGRDVLPRAAALLDAPQVSEVVAIHDAQTFTHPIYAGNVLEKVRVGGKLVLLTVRPTAFDKAASEGGNAAIETVNAPAPLGLARFLGLEATKSERPDLTSARIVVSGGRGVGSAENFRLIEQLADALGAAVGASRAAVDAGYVPNDWQVGQTGKIVAPELYIAVGLSGAIQHLAGMKESKIIVAINKDENAPIFEVADYGLVADLFAAVPEMVGAVKA